MSANTKWYVTVERIVTDVREVYAVTSDEVAEMTLRHTDAFKVLKVEHHIEYDVAKAAW